jgi:hypothetical protein
MGQGGHAQVADRGRADAGVCLGGREDEVGWQGLAQVHVLACPAGLAPGLTQQHAADLCWAHMDTHLYRSLVIQRGWTTSEYTQWLSTSLAATLLRSP